MNFKVLLYLTLTLFVNGLFSQNELVSQKSTTLLTTPSNIECNSVYSTPQLNGICMPNSICLGAALTEICQDKSHVCCIPDPALTSEPGENSFITLKRYLKFVGNTTRTNRLYYLFKRLIAEAGITTRHRAAVYFAQIIGETNYLNFFEEPKSPSLLQFDFSASIGNNETGSGFKYRGKGALLMRGRGVYINATSSIPGLTYFLSKTV
jgi:hypothetical protein